MNVPMIGKILGKVLLICAALLCLPLLTALIFREPGSALAFAATAALCALIGLVLGRLRPGKRGEVLYARDGFAIVSLSWILMSLLGALPFVLSGDLPTYADAVFETASGLSTTGATIMTDMEAMSKSCMFWRCFTHWIGGMGILVFLMAVLPMSGEHSMHIMRAEVPGPVVGKLVPRARETAGILYMIYIGMTLLEVVLLLFGKMSFYEALLHAFSSAGTGGFSTRTAGVAAFDSPYIEWILAVFTMLFGVNFNLYYLMLIRRFRSALGSEELWLYLGLIAASSLSIACGIVSVYGNFATAIRKAFFEVSTIVSTTGFSLENYELWPEYTKGIILFLTVMGGCAGSTAGGLKVSRVMILFRSTLCQIKKLAMPRAVNRVRLEGKTVSDETVRGTTIYFFICVSIIALAAFLISFDGYDALSNLTGAMTCFFNVGPGLNLTGPAGGYAMYSGWSKFVLSWCMIAGRLEVYPMLILLMPVYGKKRRAKGK